MQNYSYAPNNAKVNPGPGHDESLKPDRTPHVGTPHKTAGDLRIPPTAAVTLAYSGGALGQENDVDAHKAAVAKTLAAAEEERIKREPQPKAAPLAYARCGACGATESCAHLDRSVMSEELPPRAGDDLLRERPNFSSRGQ